MTGAARLAQVEPVLKVPDGSEVTFEWGERIVLDGRADVARITVTPYQPGMEVSVNPRVGIDPEIGEWSRSPFWGRLPFDERLKMIQVFVSAEIAAYEYDCTGCGRKADLVAEGFRAECDARRGSTVLPVPVRPKVDWTHAGSGKRSTRQRFEGYDFPPDGAGRRDSGPRGPLSSED